MAKNANLHTAKTAKNDEFYTQLSDVEKELKHYKPFFKGKKVLCNCNDDQWSAFFKYFSLNFEHLGLAKLTCVSYSESGHGKKYEFNGDLNGNRKVDDEEIMVTELKGNGDFRSVECVQLLKEADVVVTNPPFSLFREYIALMVEYDKKFLIVGNMNAITYKEVFPLIKDNNLWLGVNGVNRDWYFHLKDEHKQYMLDNKKEGSAYKIINGEVVGRLASICWYTNIPHTKRNTPLDLFKHYSPEEYPKYDNYDAIECSKTANIPMDYEGVIGVPITFLDKYCPEQFEIIGHEHDLLGDGGSQHIGQFEVNGKGTYKRILIRKK